MGVSGQCPCVSSHPSLQWFWGEVHMGWSGRALNGRGKMKWKSHNAKSMAGICKHKPSSLEPKTQLDICRGQRDDQISASRGLWEGTRKPCHRTRVNVQEPAWSQKKSHFPGAVQNCATGTSGPKAKEDPKALDQEDKHACHSETLPGNWGLLILGPCCGRFWKSPHPTAIRQCRRRRLTLPRRSGIPEKIVALCAFPAQIKTSYYDKETVNLLKWQSVSVWWRCDLTEIELKQMFMGTGSND